MSGEQWHKIRNINQDPLSLSPSTPLSLPTQLHMLS